MFENYPNDDFSVASVIAFFGRHITDEDILASFRKLAQESKKNSSSILRFILMPFFMLYMLFFAHRKIPIAKKKLWSKDPLSLTSKLKSAPTEEKLDLLFSEASIFLPYNQIHGPVSFASSLKSMFLRKLIKPHANEADLEYDLNLLLSHCNDVVSAEVPNMLREIAKAIPDRDRFKDLSDEDALAYLRSATSGEAFRLFAKFIEAHAHRGYRESDPLYLPWGKNPIPCVQVIKVSVSHQAEKWFSIGLSFFGRP